MKLRIVKGLAAVAALFGAAGPVLAQHSVKSGIEAWQRGEYAAAVATWRPLARKGDPDAQFDLGQAYRLGRGVPVDLAQAQAWLQRAAIAGHLDAQTTLGLLLFDSGDRTAAMRWLKKAAERGEPRAMLVYGTALFNGDGVPKDPVMAYAYVSRSAAQGLAPAKETLLQMDETLPADIRQKGAELATRQTKAPSTKPMQVKATPKAAPKPAPVQTAVAASRPKPAPAESTQVARKATPVPASGGWRIQLGAFSQRGSAEALYRKLSGTFGGHQAYYVPVGKITRLQVGPYPSREAAAAACGALKGQACFPVAAK